jgi:S1-C subfamily serine protease
MKATLDTLEDDATAKGPATRSPRSQPANNKLGVQVSNVKGGGVRIEAISPASPLKEVRPGDVVLEVDGKPIKDVDALESLLGTAKPGSVLLAKIRRGESTRFAPVPVPGSK